MLISKIFWIISISTLQREILLGSILSFISENFVFYILSLTSLWNAFLYSNTILLSILKSFLEISLVPIIYFPLYFMALIWFFPWSSIVFVCFSKAFPKGERINLGFSIICFWLEGNIFSPVRYSYLLNFADDKLDILEVIY